MVRISWERLPLLLFSDVHSIGPISFHLNVLVKGANGVAYQAVLVSMSAAPSKGKRGEHAMWKHAQPVSTDFAWLPEDVAEAFCALALCQDRARPYGSFHEVQWGFHENYQAWLHIEGAWKSSESLAKCRQRGFV